MTDLRTAAALLGGEVSGGQILCPGPGHSKADRSLSVKFDPSDPDKIVVHSFCGDDWKACDQHVRELLGMKPWKPNGNGHAQPRQAEPDPWDWKPLVPCPDDAPVLSENDMAQRAPAGFVFTSCWPYRDAGGRLLGFVARYDSPEDKTFLPFTLCEAKGLRQWRTKGFPEPRPLYGLETLAARPDAPVLVVEGEKKCEPARSRFPDFTCVASSNGAQSAKKADWSPLAGRHVTVWPDADKPGAEYAANVAALVMQAGAESAFIVDTHGLPEGWDLADELPEGTTDADLARRLAEAKPPQAKETGTTKPSATTGDAEVDVDIMRLARLTVVEYERQRAAAAAKLGIRTSVLDKLVRAARTASEPPKEATKKDTAGSSVIFDELEPWPEPVTGAQLLDDLAAAIAAHVILPPGGADAVALWLAHAHAHDMAAISPILAITSPTPECGKTTLLSLLGKLTPRPLPTSNVTAAALFRAVDKWRPTLLVDEADTFLSASDDLRGCINSGHNRAAAYVLRCDGEDNEPRRFTTWAPKAIALIGKLPPTTASRAIHIPLRRMITTETVKPAREDRMDYLVPLNRRLARWVADNEAALRAADPDMPTTLTGRRADNWRALVAIADVAGGDWPARSRKAAEALTAKDANATRGIMLLSDIRDIFADKGVDKIFSKDLATTLGGMLDRPWPEWIKGKPITDRQIAALLEPFEIQPRNVRIGTEQSKGYKLEQFEDAFSRYLAASAPCNGQTTVPPSQSSIFNDLGVNLSVPPGIDGTDKMSAKPLKSNDWDGGTVEKPLHPPAAREEAQADAGDAQQPIQSGSDNSAAPTVRIIL